MYRLIYNLGLRIKKSGTFAGAVLSSVSSARIEKERASTAGQRQLRRASLAALGAMLSVTLLGCGNNYRPVVTAINPVGPAAQPSKYAVAISNPSATGPGLLTIADFSGDSVLVTAALGGAPYYLALDSSGVTGYTLNCNGTVNSFSISTSLLSNSVQSATLLNRGASLLPNPVAGFCDSSSTLSTSLPSSIFISGINQYVTEQGAGLVAQFQNSPPSLRQELPVSPNPTYIAGVSGAPRVYAISRGDGSTAGQVAAIESTTNSISNTISVGVNPVYGVMTADFKRAFIMNQGSGTVSVVNAQTNTLDTTVSNIPVGTAPVWADLNPTRTQLAVLNAGDGSSPGSLSIINIPLCSAVALPSNPNCDPNNPVDAVGFGQVLATVPVGLNPQVVSVLQDGTRAYIANTGSTATCATLPTAAIPPSRGCGTVSVVNLLTNTVTATITVAGHPGFIVATQGTPTGKVYVTSPETSLMTVLRTDTDQVQTYIDLQGAGGQVRVTAQ